MEFSKPYRNNRKEWLEFLQDKLLTEDFRYFEPEDIDLERSYDYIDEAKLLGEAEELGLYVYEVRHESEYDPKVSLSREAFKIMEGNSKRSLVFFVSEKTKNFRLSLIHFSTKWTEGEKVETEFSDPRRFSFYLGPDSKTHTPKKLLENRGRISDFDELKERFSIDPVNKEFYEEIADHFYQLTGLTVETSSGKREEYEKQLELPSISDEDDKTHKEFAIRLIGRIIFVWFLKHKKTKEDKVLLPGSLVSSESVDENENYYHEILEPLFFEVLNTPIKDREDEYIFDNHENIPFLNGGLFEPHSDDYYSREGKHINTLNIPDEWFKSFFEILERYNFTIDESTSVDVEISVDPEMLGRIFENLLAEINPETQETARKETGSYYTPRTIVEYMVDESIKNYLKEKSGIENEKQLESLLSYSESKDELELSLQEESKIIDALDEMKIIDPACGSGAFPMGILQKTLLILQKVDPESKKWLEKKLDKVEDPIAREEMKERLENENWDYIHKLGIIQNSIYGVDIQPIAVEISKLRFFLSLVVDEKIDEEKENRGVKPLPNLEFKFVAANSLISLEKEEDENERGLFESELENKINDLSNLRGKYLQSYGEEKERIREDFKTTQNKLAEKVKEFGLYDTKGFKLSSWDPFSNEASDWFDPEWMFGVECFDIVIGNPPYGGDISKDERKKFSDIYKTPSFKQDTYAIFTEMGAKILESNGILTYITPYTWLTIDQHEKLREFLLNFNLLFILNIPHKVFESSDLDTVVFSLRKNKIKNPSVDLLEYNGKSEIKSREEDVVLDNIVEDGGKSKININISTKEISILNKIEKNKSAKDCKLEFSQGLIPYSRKELINEYGEKRGNEIIDERLWHSEKKKDGFKKELKGKDIKPYYIDWSGNWIKYGDWLHSPRKKKFFNQPRVLVREITRGGIKSAYTEKEFYNSPVAVNIISEDNNKDILKVFCSILNSKLGYYYHLKKHAKSNAETSIPKILVGELKNFPLISYENRCVDELVELFDDISNLKKEDGSVKRRKELKNKINEVIFEIYNLNEEEIKIIKNTCE
jgi:hypothetical protein